MKYLCFFIALVFSLISSDVIGQNQLTSEKNGSENYNLPPGVALKRKMEIVDLSFKLTGSISTQNYSQSDLKILKSLSNDEVVSLKDTDPKYYQYFLVGSSFIDSLSDKVKSIYSKDELWYIYVFDQKLKNKLLTIK